MSVLLAFRAVAETSISHRGGLAEVTENFMRLGEDSVKVTTTLRWSVKMHSFLWCGLMSQSYHTSGLNLPLAPARRAHSPLRAGVTAARRSHQ